ncbi:MAG: FHA domain-containing serine/threonine-protein kinase [Oscillatoria sp. PMC 1051.18]|nr:FHA domain-containing serine/threonine-protein kinase [Oscillatoria sp. PMC 1050.18]MEC5028722.1 FHA domain-containing serine/threonine-protein kinase [Oscillatoria sp. PMC 1051.18]
MVTLTLLHPQEQKALQQWNFPDGAIIRIGRAPDNDVVLKNFPEVSRYHLELVPSESSHWRLINKGTNGTFLNGVLVSQGLVRDESIFQLAKAGPKLKFQLNSFSVAEKSPPATPDCSHSGNSANNLFCIHCGQPLVEKERFVRQYQVLKPLGQGGMGTTYLAWDRQGTISGQPQLLVLKEMNADMAQIKKAKELFEREARILKTLNHPGIPKYYDFFIEGDKKYLAMELIHGQNLEQRIYQTGPVTPEQAVEWMIQTCDLLSYLHSLDPPLVHRDVKPANLIVRHLDNKVVLLDFGAVKEVGTPLMTRIGAEGYSAPEQNRGRPCTQSDIYAIGPTLIFLLTGQQPLNFYQRQGDGYQFAIKNVPTITRQLRQAIERACEPKLNKRYQTARELSEALSKCI